MTEALAFPALLRQAGAIMTQRDGRPVPAHYGSVAAELAVCSAGVGLGCRSDLSVISVAAAPRGIEQILTRMVGHGIAPRGVVEDSGVWWCRAASGGEVVVVCRPGQAFRLRAELRCATGRLTGGTVTDLSDSSFLLHIIGRRAGAVLADLGVYGSDRDPASAPPFAETLVAGHAVSWLLAVPSGALAIVDRESAGDVWRAVEAAGRPHRMGYVGLESIDRFVMAERAKRRAGPQL